MRITKFTQKIENLAVKFKPIFWIVSQYYKGVISREIQLADIKSSDYILCIGGGNCPFSAILLHQKTGAKITVIDNNQDCINSAQKIIAKLGLDEKISVFFQDGRNSISELSQFSVIHFAMQVSPIEEVFGSIYKKASLGTRILIRRPKKKLCKMYCGSDCAFLKFCQRINHSSASIGSTLLFVKSDSAA